MVADKEIVSKELSTETKYIELVENSNFDEIIVIDKNNEIPPYSCIIDDNSLKMSAYESRFDTEKDIETRRNDWCEIIHEFDSKK